MAAYYNEIDPKAAAWLRELIRHGHIADGVVDERSIVDVAPDELRDFAQCHFFAGIGVWSYALRSAGWADDRPVWTGSCPCQPFSAAGARGGFDDQRHLWPHWHHLISQCQPPVIFGEQVASKDGLGWLDLVCADMEATGYAIGSADLCAAGVGAPHIRQRLFFGAVRLADADDKRLEGQRQSECERAAKCSIGPGGVVVRLADADGWDASAEWQQRSGEHGQQPEDGGAGGVADASSIGWERGERPTGWCEHDGEDAGWQQGNDGSFSRNEAGDGSQRPSADHGGWSDVDWLFCRDGKWRPIESGTFPLAHGSAERVGRLRGYGNAIVAPVAATFIKSMMEVIE